MTKPRTGGKPASNQDWRFYFRIDGDTYRIAELKPHPNNGGLAGSSPLRVHVSAQHRVDLGLIPSVLFLEPFHHFSVQAQRDGLLRLGHDDSGRLEPVCV